MPPRHAARLLTDKIQPGDEEAQTILAHAAIFHDTRRIDENRDTGHGARAAEFYETFCREHPELPYRPESACIMRWHDRYKGRPIDEVANEILAPWLFPYTEQPPTELRTLTYTMAEGYAACLYTYKWCEVMAADAMSRFRKEGIFNPATGADYRRCILERGSSIPAMQQIRDFLGRDPQPDALLNQY